jgi:hypothetical protein
MQDFNSFIQSLLSNPSPQGGMMGGGGNQTNRNFYDQAGNDAYYQNPYRMQDSIDAAMLKRKEADDAMAAAMGQQMPQTNGKLDGDGGYDGDGGGGGTPSAPTVSSINAQDIAFAVLSATEGLTPSIAANLGALGLLGYGGRAVANNYFNNEIDALSNQYGATPPGMFSVSDQKGNVSTISNAASIAAQNMAEFGVTGMDTGGYNAGDGGYGSGTVGYDAGDMGHGGGGFDGGGIGGSIGGGGGLGGFF